MTFYMWISHLHFFVVNHLTWSFFLFNFFHSKEGEQKKSKHKPLNKYRSINRLKTGFTMCSTAHISPYQWNWNRLINESPHFFFGHCLPFCVLFFHRQEKGQVHDSVCLRLLFLYLIEVWSQNDIHQNSWYEFSIHFSKINFL